MANVIVASRLPMAVRMETPQKARPPGAHDAVGAAPPPAEPPEPIKTADIAGERAVEKAGEWGVTREVDGELVEQWLAVHPEHKENLKVVSEDELKKMADTANTYGFEIGLKEAEAAAKEQPAPNAAHAAPAPGAPAGPAPHTRTPPPPKTP